MAAFSYTATNAAGKTVKSTILADTEDAAVAELKATGHIIVSITVASSLAAKAAESGAGGGKKKKVKTKELAVFCRQLVSILEAGVAVIEALAMLEEQTENQTMRDALQGCRKAIEQGETFSDAMKAYPKVFPPMLVTLVKAGEASGSMEISFTRMAIQFEKDAKVKASMQKAAIYPSVVMVVAFAVVIVMLIEIVPTFETMFADMGQELPAITIFVVGLSEYMQRQWYVVVGVVFGFVTAIKLWSKTMSGRTVISAVNLKLPVLSNLVIKTACARIARTLSTLLGSGLAIIEAIEITGDTMSNLQFKAAVAQVAEEVSLGAPMNVPLRECGKFPPLMYHMVSIGEETGNTEKMLDTLAEYYEDEVEVATESLMTLIEPFTIILLAVLVGGIIGAVMAPMASIYSGMEGI